MRDSKLHKLAFGIIGIYVSYVIYAIFQEKLFNYEFPSSKVAGQKDKFTHSSCVVIFPTLVSFLYGIAKGKFDGDAMDRVPVKQKALLGALFFTVVQSANTALVYVSYPLQLLVRNLRLMAIFLVGCFFSRMKKTEGGGHLGYGKLLVGSVITIGVVIFNHYSVPTHLIQNEKKKGSEQSHIIGLVLLATSVIADGFFLDSQAYSKKMFKPSSNELFTYTNGVACLIATCCSIFTGEFAGIVQFVTSHHEIALYIAGLSVLGTVGQLFIYYIVKNFQPYVTAIITTIRKIITVMVSIVLFQHTLTPMQWVGVLVVFIGVGFELVDEMNGKQHKKHESNKEHSEPAPSKEVQSTEPSHPISSTPSHPTQKKVA